MPISKPTLPTLRPRASSRTPTDPARFGALTADEGPGEEAETFDRLIGRMAQGETDAVRAFFDRYGRLLYAAAFVCGLSFAMKSAVTGAVVGAVMGGLTSAFSDGNVLEGTLSGFADGFFDGFMWGGITAGVSNVIKPGSFCFIAGTKVLTDSGQKNIEDIEVGDQVLAYDEETGVTA